MVKSLPKFILAGKLATFVFCHCEFFAINTKETK